MQQNTLVKDAAPSSSCEGFAERLKLAGEAWTGCSGVVRVLIVCNICAINVVRDTDFQFGERRHRNPPSLQVLHMLSLSSRISMGVSLVSDCVSHVDSGSAQPDVWIPVHRGYGSVQLECEVSHP